ncbi:hypothetical protein [Kineosporia babensis]|uniref:Restriction endonuclease n=1 Tax=Kineosporia babensis TaxID=499548 RepID=A0A9X1NMG9_9ACTN|nr:hypothetical protein [Kineosporia babensis]MCD5317085.1 hypothetical protein [Kineosporia babensis]
MALYSAHSHLNDGFGWQSDGSYLYTGSTREKMNEAVLDSLDQGRTLHLLENLRNSAAQRYIEPFVLANVFELTVPRYYPGGELVTIPVFKLTPVLNVVHRPWEIFDSLPGGEARVVPVERHELIRWEDPELADEVDRLRPEAVLENAFCRYLLSQGIAFHRWQITYDSSHRPLLTDVWIPAHQLLVESKASSSRESIREAIGQLIDYTRFVKTSRRAVLVPEAPSADLLALLHSQEIAAIWPGDSGGWEASVNWLRGFGKL